MAEEEKKPLEEKIMEAIKEGRIKMRPKWHFILRTALLVIGIIIVFLALLYLASFIFFMLRINGVILAPTFGGRGAFVFLFSLPWLLLLLAAIFAVVLETLIKHYAFAYRRPILYSILGIILAIVLGSFIVSRIAIHERLFHEARRGRLPLVGSFYREFGAPRFRDIHRGKIVDTFNGGLILENLRQETSTVMFSPETQMPQDTQLMKGDSVVIFGPQDDGMIKAVGIRKIED